ncbi:MAG: methionine--tRNA ligase [Candidatus Micrarchaeia archaeon]
MKYIITSALPYASGIPHLGNMVGSVLPADIFFKFMKMCNEDAIFICGSDQHGTPIELEALKKKVKPSEFADSMHLKIKEGYENFGCEFTYYGKTATEENKEVVYEIFNNLNENGYITRIKSEQAYCTFDKRFLSDRFIEGTCPYCGYASARGDQCDNCGRLLNPKDLVKPHCTICGKESIEFRETENLAFDMKLLDKQISDFIKENSKNNWSKNAINHSLNYIKRGLEAREITRDLKWGFEVPLEGFKDKVFYVWFDAVIGYIGITKEWSKSKWQEYWKGDTELIQFMGKDNIEFHTLLWPGILIGSKLGYVLPHTIYAYEYLNSGKLKFSKSRGIGLNIENALEIMPSDYWRFVLAELLPEGADVEFSVERVKEIVDNDMNNIIGNFVHRTLSLAKSNTSSTVPEFNEELLDKDAKEFIKKREEAEKKYIESFRNIQIREALHSIIEISSLGNAYISATEPWVLAKSETEDARRRLGNIMYLLLDTVYKISNLLYPFTPKASLALLKRFNMEHAEASCTVSSIRSGSKIDLSNLEPIFSKLTDKMLGSFKKYKE